MSDIFANLFEDSVTLMRGGDCKVVGKGHDLFDKTSELVREGRYELAWKRLAAGESIPPKAKAASKVEVRSGQVFVNSEPLPSGMSRLFFQAKARGSDLEPLFKLWFNLKYDSDMDSDEKVRKGIFSMLRQNARVLDKQGRIVVYEGPRIENCPAYMVKADDSPVGADLLSGMSLENILDKYLGSPGKKAQAWARRRVFRDGEVRCFELEWCGVFESFPSDHRLEIARALEFEKMGTAPRGARDFFAQMGKKRFMNMLASGPGKVESDLAGCLEAWLELGKKRDNLELDLKRYKNLKDMAIAMGRLVRSGRKLEQEQRFPTLAKLDRERTGGYVLRVARDAGDLFEWGERLGICVGNGGYERSCLAGEKFLFCLRRGGKTVYCGSAGKNGRIKELKGLSNKKADLRLTELVEAKLREAAGKAG